MGAPPDGRGGPHTLTTDLETLELSDEDRHHLSRVLRLRAGDSLTATDGAGRWRSCRWTGDGAEPDGDVVAVPAPEPLITVGFPAIKGDRPDWAVQKLTELGVDRILLLRTERSVVRWEGGKAEARIERFRRIAREASLQSRRVRLPEIFGPHDVADVVALTGGPVVRAERGGGPLGLDAPTVVIGPEGGWSAAELADGLPTVDLGEPVLRVETAALAAAVTLTVLRRDPLDRHGECC